MKQTNAHLAGDKPESTAQVEPPSSLPYVLPKLRAIEGRATVGIGIGDGTRIATMSPSIFQWQRADAIITACNAYPANQARIRELEAALKDCIRWLDVLPIEYRSHPEFIGKQARAALGAK